MNLGNMVFLQEKIKQDSGIERQSLLLEDETQKSANGSSLFASVPLLLLIYTIVTNQQLNADYCRWEGIIAGGKEV